MKKINVLVVENNPATSSSIADSINHFFFKKGVEVEVVEVGNLKEAVNFLRDDKHDLITLDGELSCGHHGLDVLREMSLDQIYKTIVYSGEMNFVFSCRQNGIQAFLKSNPFAEVLPIIENRIIKNKK